MKFAKQRVRATVARKKEEKKPKETEGGPSSAPKTVSKVSKGSLMGRTTVLLKRLPSL